MSLLLRFIGKNVRQHQVLIRTFYSTTTTKSIQSMGPLLSSTTTTIKLSSKLLQRRSWKILNQIQKLKLSSNAASGGAHHDHTKIWVLEKMISAALLAVIPVALIYQNPVMDYLLAFSLVIHTHWGFEAIVVDYIRPSLVGPVIPKIALASIYLISMIALAGLFYLNYSDVGTSTAIKMFAKNVY